MDPPAPPFAMRPIKGSPAAASNRARRTDRRAFPPPPPSPANGAATHPACATAVLWPPRGAVVTRRQHLLDPAQRREDTGRLVGEEYGLRRPFRQVAQRLDVLDGDQVARRVAARADRLRHHRD